MSRRETWGLRLIRVGLVLGVGLMLYVVTFDASSFYQNFVASTTAEATPPLGYVLDGGILLAFASTVAGIACFSVTPSEMRAPALARAAPARVRSADPVRRDERRRLRRRPSVPHGST